MSSGIASAAVSGAVTALPGAGTVASAVVNGVAGAAVEAHNQYSTYAEKKRRGQKQNTRLEIAASIGKAAVVSALPSVVGSRSKSSVKTMGKAANWKGAGRAGGKTVAQNAFCYLGLWTVKGYVAKNKRFQKLKSFFRLWR